MAKKFWEREDFDIAMFAAVFQGVYTVLYDYCASTPYELLEKGNALLFNKETAGLQKMFAYHREDIISSDREAAAFAVTYGIYERYNELHE